jgi:hypothetical protein
MEATISITNLYQLLIDKVGRETTEKLTSYIESKVKNEVESNVSHLATKEDLEPSSKERLRWMIILFIPLYLSILGLIVTLLVKK